MQKNCLVVSSIVALSKAVIFNRFLHCYSVVESVAKNCVAPALTFPTLVGMTFCDFIRHRIFLRHFEKKSNAARVCGSMGGTIRSIMLTITVRK